MRQPTNLRGATLPGFSQPSIKEGPHHTPFQLPRLQLQPGFFSFFLLLWRDRVSRFKQQSTAASKNKLCPLYKYLNHYSTIDSLNNAEYNV